MSRPGAMDQRITIQRVTGRTDDGMGGFTETVTDLGEAWAHVSAKGGTEQEREDRVNAEATVTFTIRNRRDWALRANDRITWQGVGYNIRVVEDEGDRAQYLTLLAERGVAD